VRDRAVAEERDGHAAVASQLRGHGVAVAWTEWRELPRITELTADFLYLRWLGDRRCPRLAPRGLRRCRLVPAGLRRRGVTRFGDRLRVRIATALMVLFSM
jgi:hypothetical protein